MAKPRKARRAPTPAPTVKRRAAGADKQRLPPELEALARGDDGPMKAKSRGPRRPRLRDPRQSALIPGVANRDARAVFAARVEAMRALESDAERSIALAEATLLRLWRGRSVTGLEALAENVLGLDATDARALAAKGAESLGVPLSPWSDEAVAVWMRAEAALIESGLTARVGPAPGDSEAIRLEMDMAKAPEALHGIGRRMTPLVRDREPREVREAREARFEQGARRERSEGPPGRRDDADRRD